MPIKPIVLQRRLAEVGRIRIGETKVSKGGKTYPSKLDRLRFTSASRPLVEQIAAAYGGQVAEWTPLNGGAQQWEVITDVARVPVIVPPQSVSQYMESWSGGGAQRRCDGETELLSNGPCLCAAEDEMACKPTTRLSVMLRDIPGLGVWRLESKGWNAAAELPDTAEFLARAGGYVGAWLYLKPQRSVAGGQTRDWMVPALEVEGITPAQLLAGGGAPAAVEQAQRQAIEAGDGQENRPPMTAESVLRAAEHAPNEEVLRQVWQAAREGGVLTEDVKTQLLAIRERLGDKADEKPAEAKPAKKKAAEKPEKPAAKQAEPAETAEQVWERCISAAGKRDLTLSQLEEAYARTHQGVLPASATAEELRGFLTDLETGWVEDKPPF